MRLCILMFLLFQLVMPKSQHVFQLCNNKFNLAESLSDIHYQVTELHTINNKRAQLVSYVRLENQKVVSFTGTNVCYLMSTL